MKPSTFPGKQPDPVPGQLPLRGRTEGVDRSDSVLYDGGMDRNAHLQAQPGECFAEGTIKRLHVDQHAIKAFIKDGEARPCITIQLSDGPRKCHEVDIDGPVKLVARLDNPLSCGARVWIETHAKVQVIA